MIQDGLVEYLMPLRTVPKNFARLDTQRLMLQDRVRVAALQRAITAAVQPGDVVLEIGTGTGLLAILAARAGARRVYAIEMTEMVEVAREMVRRNGLAAQIQILEGVSFEIELPERADVLISETLGHLGIDEGIVQTVADARRRLLKPHALQVPISLDILLALTADRAAQNRELAFWRQPLAGVDCSAAADAAAGRVYLRRVMDSELLSHPRIVAHIDLTTAEQPPAVFGACLAVCRAGEVSGIAAWFECQLFDDVRLMSRSTSNWYPVLFPVDPPLAVAPMEEVRSCITVREHRGEAAWSWCVRGVSGERRCGRCDLPDPGQLS
ncbi:MAG: 50S ribosomal protein L11 methyltransferase [Acidobacteriota bacterium]